MRTWWDLIVVGAGSSGAAFAARSVERGATVLLLEAGADYPAAELPEEWRSPNPLNGLLSPTLGNYLWNDLEATRTEQQEPSLYWRGRGVGGSSTVNGQIAIRPPMEDFDAWTDGGCKGWTRDDVTPYFSRLENDAAFGNKDYHGNDGPTPIYRAPQDMWGAVDLGLRDAASAYGFGWAEDVNAPDATGVSPYPINSAAGQRVSTNDAYLEPLRTHPGLEIWGNALVDSVVFDGPRARGVRLADGRVAHGGEVVLCAGVIGSPAILMRSGVGPTALLSRLGIPVRAALAVGQGMQDHPMSVIGLPLTADHSAGPNDRHTNCCVRYSSGDVAGGNDMFIVALNQNALAMNSADIRAGAGALGVFVNLTYSRGNVEIASTDPLAQPRVRENMLSDPRDLRRLRTGVRLMSELVDTAPIRDICDGDPWRVNTELQTALAGSDHDLDGYLRRTIVDTQHGTSTCQMGAVDKPTTVVDSECRVLGLENLRVVDASVFPFVPRANTNLTAIMIGEAMADRI